MRICLFVFVHKILILARKKAIGLYNIGLGFGKIILYCNN